MHKGLLAVRHLQRHMLGSYRPHSQKSFCVETASIGCRMNNLDMMKITKNIMITVQNLFPKMNITHFGDTLTNGAVERKGEPMSDLIDRQAAIDAVRNYLLECQIEDGDYHADGIMYELDCLPSVQPEQKNERIFQEIVVEYPSISTYPECEGKPYFSIKYTEDRQDFIGYGTYKPDVLSEYLKKDFMPSAQPEPEHTMEEFMYGQELGNPEDGSL